MVTKAATSRSRLGALNMVSPVNWLHPLNQGLLDHWPCIHGMLSGTRLIGLRQKHSTLVNGVSVSGSNQPGVFGALKFDGVDDYVSMGVSSGRTQFTASIYFTPVPTETYDTALLGLTTNSGTGYDWMIYLVGSTQAAFYWKPSAGGTQSLTATTTGLLNSGKLVHVTVTFKSGEQKIYVNGLLRGSGTVADTIANNFYSFRMGIGWTRTYIGMVHDIRLYNRVLSECECGLLHKATIAGYPNELNWLSSPTYFDVAGGFKPAWALRRSRIIGGGVT